MGGVTRNGSYGVLREYHVDEAQPYDIELTAGYLRLWRAGAQLVTEPGLDVADISTDDPADFYVPGHGYSTGDQVICTLEGATTYAGIDQILGRQLSVTVIGVNDFSLSDALTGTVIDGSLITFANITGLVVYKIFELTTSYAEADLQQVRIVQDGADALLLHNSYKPKKLTITTNSDGVFSTAALTDVVFHDGPYLDFPSDGSTLTPNATSGSITFTVSATTSVNSGKGFLSSDVGRQFRFFSEPLAWASGTAYTAGNLVKEAGTYWKAVQSSTGVQPSTDNGTNWVIDPTAAAWTWGTISSISSPTAFVGTLASTVTYPDNTASGNLLYTNAAVAWQLGAYSDTTGYPSCGAYYQGRVWLGGAAKNRFDACVSNDFSTNGYINFAPTGLDGTVADNNGISGTLNAKEVENFLWMLPDEQGVLAGTQSGEWIISSSGGGEPITPTSIATREMTHYGSINTPAIKIDRVTVFVQRDGRKVYEYMANYFTQKFVADNLTLRSKHLTVSGVAELAYMRELTPVIWARLNNGGLIGCTYKHDDPIKPIEFNGWHRHQLGTGRNVISIQGGPANGGETDTLSLVTQDPDTGFCFVEFLQTLWDDSDDLLSAWYLDGGLNAAAAEKLTVDGVDVIRIYGLWYIAGETVSVWAAGVDCGDFTVTLGGTLDVPLNVGTSLFTDSRLEDVTALGCTSLSTDIVGTEATAAHVFVMSAEENYDPTRVAYIDGLSSYSNVYIMTDQNFQGVQWDAVNRNLMYMYCEFTPSSPLTNTTGHPLWDGEFLVAVNGTLSAQTRKNSWVCQKNIDTGQVSFYENYSSANVVPSGIGGSDGTYRRATLDFSAGYTTDSHGNHINSNGPGMTDPYTANFWVNSQSCELYCFRAQDNYSQIISPLVPQKATNNDVMIVGFTNNGATKPWSFAREIDLVSGTAPNTYLYLVPKDITAAEITADYLLIYATYDYPILPVLGQADNGFYTAYNREVFDHSGNMYLFSCTPSGGKSFTLYRFSPPTAANYPSAAVGGGFTNITPWSSSTGPNSETGYTLARGDDSVAITSPSVIPMYLPVTDDLVLIEKFFPVEHGSSDPALMKWSCTYVHGPSGTPTFDHHSAFVTGYMTSDWVSTDINGAAYAVTDAFEVNNYLGQSDYNYSTMDYTKRWFFFVCQKMQNGVRGAASRIVLVEYQFVYGSAPTVLQVIDEQGWDDRYPDYAPKASDQYGSVADTPAVAVSMATGYNPDEYIPLWDSGIYDPVTNSFWWSGGSTSADNKTAFFCQFDPNFANRMKKADGEPGGTIPAATPPFMKLSFAKTYCAPFLIGHTYCSQGQILRPVTPNESMTQTGPSLGKYRRATSSGVLFNDAQGVKVGVDFLTMRTCDFKSMGGTVSIPLTETFSGIYWSTVDANSNYDNMWCWEVCRPYPCTVVAVELQHKTNENV
jgi:hypothetical protein